ncbi:MAG: calcium/sodium antiporter [Lachnospiraceae bacterium]|nr:calcium/sodium antiporter [Lachnospiraceae bacterium]
MEWLTIVLFLIVGLVLIVKGGDFFVDAASWIAEVSGIPKLIVGATVVSFATTLPELLVSTIAAGKGEVELCIGNAVGSVIANTAMIMAISLICMPAIIKRKDYLNKSILLLAAIITLAIASWDKSLGIVGSIILIIIFALAMADNVRDALASMKAEREKEEKIKPTGKEIFINIVKFVLGVAGIIIGADLLVDNGQELALMLGVSPRIVGITVLAVGTSLPELVTTITAIAKKQHSLSVGNIIGANTIDLTLILSVSTFIYGGSLPVQTRVDMIVCLAVTVIALVPTLITKKFTRIQGVILFACYIAYIALSCMNLLTF